MKTWIIRSLPLLLAGPAMGVLPLDPLFDLQLTAETVAYGLSLAASARLHQPAEPWPPVADKLMDMPQTDKSSPLGSVGEPGPSAGSGADGFSSKWSHILAEPIATSWGDEESERRVDQFTSLAWKFWSAAYAYLRCKGCDPATTFHDLRRALDYVPGWLGRQDIAHPPLHRAASKANSHHSLRIS